MLILRITYIYTYIYIIFIRFIVESAEKFQLDYFVPCHGSIHCVTVSLDDIHEHHYKSNLSNISVIAGHFFWNVWNQLPTFINYNSSLNKNSNKNNTNETNTNASRTLGTFTTDNNNDHKKKKHEEMINNNSKTISSSPPPPSASCFVMGRHPIERAISYYYQRYLFYNLS